MTPCEAAAVFSAFERADDYESLMWRVDMASPGHTMRLLAICSDFFHLATADAEEVTAADIPMLEQCLADLLATGEPYFLAELFAARKRRMRPHALSYKTFSNATAVLFDACSTPQERAGVDERDRGFWAHLGQQIREGKA